MRYLFAVSSLSVETLCIIVATKPVEIYKDNDQVPFTIDKKPLRFGF